MQASLAHHPTPRMTAAQLLKGWGWRLRLHALKCGAIRANGTAAGDGSDLYVATYILSKSTASQRIPPATGSRPSTPGS
jgi:hypothetical protein